MAIRPRLVWIFCCFAVMAWLTAPTPSVWAQDDPEPAEGDQQPASDHVATVTFSAGLNRVRRAATNRLERAATDMKLFEGDTLKISSRGRVTMVYVPGGAYQSLGAGEGTTITSRQASAEQTADMDKVSESMVMSLRSEKEGTLAAVGGTRDRRNPALPFMRSPRNTLLLPGDVVRLSWETPEGAPDRLFYEVVMLSEGREVLRERTIESSLSIPAERVEAGRLYYWYVMRADMPKVPAAKAMFRVIPAGPASAIRQMLESNLQLAAGANDLAPVFMNARLLYQESLFADALARYQQVYRVTPGDRGLLNAIRASYRAMGFFPADIDRYVSGLRSANPEFTPATDLIVTPVVAPGTVELTFQVTEHPDVLRYRITWWPKNQPEPATVEPQFRRDIDHPVSSDHITLRLTGIPAGEYRVRVRSLGTDGNPLRFDVDENLVETFRTR